MLTLMQRRVSTGATAVISSFFTVAAATAGGPPTVLYSLDANAAYAQGCFGNPGQVPQCMCPIALAGQFSGTFGLTQTPGGFAISNIDWTASLSSAIHITGSGVYTVGTDPGGEPVQGMTLELFFDGAGPVTFESGEVAGGDPGFPPQINISIGDGFGCPGVRITVGAEAAAASPADVAPHPGDGVVGILDFLAVLADWGLSGPRVTDIDGSGTVGIGDLLIVLGEWSQ